MLYNTGLGRAEQCPEVAALIAKMGDSSNGLQSHFSFSQPLILVCCVRNHYVEMYMMVSVMVHK
jgi:hypothetical protein